MTTASMFHQAKFGTSVDSAAGDTAAATQAMEFISCSMAKRGTIIGGQGISGTRSQHSERTRTGPYSVSGQIVVEPSPEELALWLPRILGTAPSGTTYALAETLPYFNICEDRIAKVFDWRSCKVDKATFASSGGVLRLTLDVEGLTEVVGNSGTFPSITITHTAPYIFEGDAVLTLQSSAREVKDFELVIDNQLVKDRWMNSLSRVSLPEGARIITLKTSHAYTATDAALYAQALAGAAGTLVFTNGNYSTTFTFGTLQVPPESPTADPGGEYMLTLNMVARMLSTTKELVVTHDSTP